MNNPQLFRKTICKIFNLLFLIILSLIIIQCDLFTENTTENDDNLVPPELYNIDTHVVWNPKFNPYLIEKDVTVYKKGTLEIQAGVDVILFPKVLVYDPAGNYFRYPIFEIQDGSILCKGQENNKIVFRDSASTKVLGEFVIGAENADTDYQSIFEGIEAYWLRWKSNRNAIVKNSNITQIDVFNNEYLKIESNQVERISVHNGTGLIKDNIISSEIIILNDSILVEGNFVKDSFAKGGIMCSHNSKAIISHNIIQNCNTAIYLFFASPVIHENNIIENNFNIVIMPEWGKPQFDTIDAINNWWGTTDSTEIANKIDFRRNGDTESGKKVKFVPFALQPFDL